MKYTPSLPGHNDNISHRHPVAEFALLLSGLVIAFSLVYLLLGFCVDLAAESISYRTESALFKVVGSRYTFSAEKEDPDRLRLQGLVEKLQRCTSIPYPITVHMVDSDEANAVALPGGHIAVFRGLLHTVDSDNGLSFVLAHELGHFENRDHLRNLGRSLVVYALSAMITGGDSSISTLLAPSANLTSAKYTRTRESLADRLALDTLACHSNTVQGATAFFDFLLQNNQQPTFKLFSYFSTHPATQQRIDELKRYAEAKGYNTLK